MSFGCIGGEEFAVALATRAGGRGVVAESCADARRDDGRHHVSFGVTDAYTAGRTVRGMLHSTDLALYRAQRGGRDRVVTADVVMAYAGG